jgi:hypothetical protein
MIAKFIDSILDSVITDSFVGWWIRILFILAILLTSFLIILLAVPVIELVVLTAPYSLFVVCLIAVCVVGAILKKRSYRG